MAGVAPYLYAVTVGRVRTSNVFPDPAVNYNVLSEEAPAVRVAFPRLQLIYAVNVEICDGDIVPLHIQPVTFRIFGGQASDRYITSLDYHAFGNAITGRAGDGERLGNCHYLNIRSRRYFTNIINV
jgi:hypothetical protein